MLVPTNNFVELGVSGSFPVDHMDVMDRSFRPSFLFLPEFGDEEDEYGEEFETS